MAKNSFVIYHHYRETLEDLTDEQVGILMRAIFDYEIDGRTRSIPFYGCLLKAAILSQLQ